MSCGFGSRGNRRAFAFLLLTAPTGVGRGGRPFETGEVSSFIRSTSIMEDGDCFWGVTSTSTTSSSSSLSSRIFPGRTSHADFLTVPTELFTEETVIRIGRFTLGTSRSRFFGLRSRGTVASSLGSMQVLLDAGLSRAADVSSCDLSRCDVGFCTPSFRLRISCRDFGAGFTASAAGPAFFPSPGVAMRWMGSLHRPISAFACVSAMGLRATVSRVLNYMGHFVSGCFFLLALRVNFCFLYGRAWYLLLLSVLSLYF